MCIRDSGKSNVTMLGGNVSIFARESDVEISDGTNLTLGPDSVPEFIDRIEAFAAYWDEEVMAYAEDTGRSIEDAQTLLSGGSIETVIGG